MYNLKVVHEAVEEGKYGEAFRILEQLRERYLEFGFYAETALEIENHFDASLSLLQDVTLSDSTTDDSLEELIEEAEKLAAVGNKIAARNFLDRIYLSGKRSLRAMLALAKVDLMERKFADALEKAKSVLTDNSKYGLAYEIAAQACIELGELESATRHFLNMPINYPDQPGTRNKNPALRDNFVVSTLKGPGNDYAFILEKASVWRSRNDHYELKASIILTTYHRARFLANTLAALTHQTYPGDLLEVVVADDGSDDIMRVIRKYEKQLNLVYVKHKDAGHRAAAQNLGIRASTGDVAIFMDRDVMPLPKYVEAYMEVMHVTDKAVLIGHQPYVDVSNINDESILSDIECVQLPSIITGDAIFGGRDSESDSIDWRYSSYEKTDCLKTDVYPFTKVSGENVAIPKKLIEACGMLSEEIQAWSCEDDERAYRLYNAGAYFIPMTGIRCLHQKLPGDDIENFEWIEHEINERNLQTKMPDKIREHIPGEAFSVPEVSIYMPAYNAERYIVDAVNSCLEQDFKDLEVCICNDGSIDGTLKLLEENFGQDSRVRWVSQKNQGIAKATDAAISLCRGMYIGQLDADDLLKQGAISACVDALDSPNVDAVYTDHEHIDGKGNPIRASWCNGNYDRRWLFTVMTATHFRMFRRRVWERIERDNFDLCSAVDFDIWNRISEVANISHIHKILYQYRWHAGSTSNTNQKKQKANHINVIERSLKRMRLDRFWRVRPSNDPVYVSVYLEPVINPDPPNSSEIVVLIPCCVKNKWKMQSIRASWMRSFHRMGFRCFFLLGDPTLVNAHLDGDTIYVPCKDDYEHLILKLMLGYGFLYRNFEFDYLLKMDDDTYPNVLKFLEVVIPQLGGYQYYGGIVINQGVLIGPKWHFGKCASKNFEKEFHTDKAPVSYANGSSGYFIRRDVVPALVEQQAVYEEELARYKYQYEDIRTAEELRRIGVHVTRLKNYVVYKSDEEIGEDWALVYDINSEECFKQLSLKSEF